MGSAHSIDMKKEAVELASTSSSDVESYDDEDNTWLPLSAEEDSDEDDDEENEALKERLRILEDSRKLRKMAEFFLHPEKPVQADAAACGRCYFQRGSAPQQTSLEESEEAAQIVEEVMSLKKLAMDYMHPELPVKNSDALACARCYFERASAPQQDLDEDQEEKAQILADLHLLKKAAYNYLHPEAPVETTDPTLFGRNYFIRCSTPEYLLAEEATERELILKDAKELSKLARNTHVATEPVVFGRNYFDRPDAPEHTTPEEEEEKRSILRDAAALRNLAKDYLHPELPVETSPTVYARNYFTRPSAPEQEEEGDEREAILQDAQALRNLAKDYLRPELPVETKPELYGRNYFTRPSAPEQEYEDERQLVLADCEALKKLAMDYLHPELHMETKPELFGRNYFTRSSAPEQEDEEERQHILADAMALKKLATTFLHPELAVETNPAAFERNYFNRPSAPNQEEDDEERQHILEDARALKKLATTFLHSELAVETNPAAFGRNYFNRSSAPNEEEDEEERQHILEDARALKKLATTFLHPELPVETNPAAFGRNYCTRPSAPNQEEDEEERQHVLEDAKALKKLAIAFLHPECPLETDATVSGRNYFTRPRAPNHEDEEEMQLVLEDAKALKKLATDFLHPELRVETNPAAFGRNYFTRPSAPEHEDNDDEERQHVIEDANALKKLATNFLHPELPVVTDPAVVGRNYLNRPSAPEQEDDDEERQRILEDAKALKKLATYFLHPEQSIETHPAASGRNYFTRPSAPVQEDEEEREKILGHAKALGKLATEFLHPELPLKINPAVYGRNYFNRLSAPLSSPEDLKNRAVGYLKHLKKRAMGYLHPSESEVTNNDEDLHFHHAHFDMDDDIHLHHVEFDRNTDHHEEITEVRVTTPTPTRAVINDFDDHKLTMSPGCVMTFAHPKELHLPLMESN